MSGIYWLLIGMAIFGFFPFGIFIYKRRRVKTILKKGITARATVYQVTRRGRAQYRYDAVYYYFNANDGRQYAGLLSIAPGKYRLNDTLEIYYIPANPKRNAVKGAWGSPALLIFLLLLALFVLFAVYKIYEMI